MNVLPHALAKGFPTYMALRILRRQLISRCFLVKIVKRPFQNKLFDIHVYWHRSQQTKPVGTPGKCSVIAIICFSTNSSILDSTQMSKQYVTRSLKTVYQALHPNNKAQKLFLVIVDNRGAYVDFPVTIWSTRGYENW